jgi:predicted RNase H-like HicB family nuclease
LVGLCPPKLNRYSISIVVNKLYKLIFNDYIMENQNCVIDEKDGLSINIVVREEKNDEEKLIIVNNEELGIADFGESMEEAISNFKKSARLYLETYPEKKALLKNEAPLLVSRIFL